MHERSRIKGSKVQRLMHKTPTWHSTVYTTRGHRDTGCRKCLACPEISVLSLANNSTMNSGLTKGVRQVMKCSKWDSLVDWLSQIGHGFSPKLVLVRVWQRACSAAVPCVPWSRAMSHSLGQVVWVAIWAARNVLWCRLASLRQAFESVSRINFLIPHRPWVLLSAFKTRSVTLWQSSLFSSDRHSCMSLRDWGLATAREVYIWQPMDSPPELTLERRFNF